MIETLENGNYYGDKGKILSLHTHFKNRLMAMKKVRNVVGVGGMIAFEHTDKTEVMDVFGIVKDLFEAGVICLIAGSNPAKIRFLPPLLAIDADIIDDVCDIIEKTI
jgi:acetylornithine aminotransferase